MANTYTQIHIQTVFAIRNRQCLINKNWEDDLYKYITGINQNNGHKLLQINGMPDHIHIFFGMRPKQSLSDLMKKVKEDSSEWINKKGFLNDRFSWQAGYGGFSYAKSEVPQVISNIQKQKEHHKKKTFMEEYLDFLKSFDIDYDERYLFKPVL
jgi:REP element-mobilizing transposase RayT